MENEFTMIVRHFDKEIVIYPISDVHLGCLEHNEDEWNKFIECVKKDPKAYVILVGDLMNNATRSSVSDIFEDVYTPSQQKKLLIKYLTPIKDKILCAVSGNHERRSIKDADNDPTYDIMCKLDLEDIYRKNIAFLKVQIGKHSTYTFAVTHGTGGGIYTGAAVNRNERFGHVIDGLDCLIVGHTHKGIVSKPSKIVIDSRNNVVSLKSYTVISTQSWLNYGGYAVQKMLLPASSATSENGQKLYLARRPKNIKVVW